MDLDRAILALKRLNPVAALIVTLFRDGWSMDEIHHTVGTKLHTPAARLIDKSVAFLSAYLSGADEDAQREAYRRGRKVKR